MAAPVILAIHPAALTAGIVGLFWLLPSVIVADFASRNGFRFWSYLLAALFVSWPFALTANA